MDSEAGEDAVGAGEGQALARLGKWFRRVDFPNSSKTPLGWSLEWWDTEPKNYEGCFELRARYAARGWRPTKATLVADLSEHLLDEVLVAAGGIEQATARLKAAVHKLETWAAEKGVAEDGSPHVLNDELALEAWFAFAEVTFWARNLDERLERDARGKLRKQGLIPALRPVRLAKRAEQLRATLKTGPLEEARLLANFGLHAALIRSPLSEARLLPSGSVMLPLPNTPTGRIENWNLLTWSDDRDALTLAEELWQSVQDFIDGLLTAFEKAVPRRFRLQEKG